MFAFAGCSTLLELNLRWMHQLRNSKAVKKARKAEVKKLNAEVSTFRESLASKERELTDLKGSHSTEVDSLKEQIASLQKAANVQKWLKRGQ